MRLFIALEMPDEVRDQLRPCLTRLARLTHGVKWVAAENLHLTLKFLGEVSDHLLPDLNAMLASVAEASHPFVLKHERAGLFYNGGDPSVVWVGLAVHQQLSVLARRVALESERLVPSADRKPFRAHITLGRVRQPYGGPPLQTALELIDTVGLPDWSVRELSLIKSELTPRGPIYTVLSRQPLGGE